MYFRIYRISTKILRKNTQVVWLLLWQTVFVMITALTMLNQGLHPSAGPLGSSFGLNLSLAIYLFLLVPYFTGGFLGTLGEAMRQNPITIRSLFSSGLRYFGRSYGLIFMALLSCSVWLLALGLVYILTHMILGLPLLSSLVVLIGAGLVLGIFFGIRILWIMNLLFVAGLKLPKALKYVRLFQQHTRCASLAALMTGVGGQIALLFASLWLTQVAQIAGQLIGWLLMMFFTIFWTLSFMVLYSLTKKTVTNPSGNTQNLQSDSTTPLS